MENLEKRAARIFKPHAFCSPEKAARMGERWIDAVLYLRKWSTRGWVMDKPVPKQQIESTQTGLTKPPTLPHN